MKYALSLTLLCFVFAGYLGAGLPAKLSFLIVGESLSSNMVVRDGEQFNLFKVIEEKSRFAKNSVGLYEHIDKDGVLWYWNTNGYWYRAVTVVPQPVYTGSACPS